jgi:hypothetical protein
MQPFNQLMEQIQIVKLGDFYFPDLQDSLDSISSNSYCKFTVPTGYISIPEPDYRIPNLIEEYSCQKLMEILNQYRISQSISNRVVLIGVINKPIERNHFSFTDSLERNSVITINDIEKILGNIALEDFLLPGIVEHAVAIIEDHSWHKEPRRCLFDFCGDKRDIIQGMTHRALCESCNLSLSQEAKSLLKNSFNCIRKTDPISFLSEEMRKMKEESKRVIHTERYFEKVEGGYHEHNYAQEQNLATAASEIQKLLDQLAQSYPNSTEATLVQAIQVEIQRNPTLKARLINALKSGGVEALKAIFNHPFVSVPVETIKGFLEAEAE